MEAGDLRHAEPERGGSDPLALEQQALLLPICQVAQRQARRLLRVLPDIDERASVRRNYCIMPARLPRQAPKGSTIEQDHIQVPLQRPIEGTLEIDEALILVDCHLAGHHPRSLGQRPYLTSVAIMER